MIGLLTQQFSNEGAADGEEYARALDTQANAECFIVEMSALLADRRETMNAERTTLALHEHKDKAKRKTFRSVVRNIIPLRTAPDSLSNSALNAGAIGDVLSTVTSHPEQVALQSQLALSRKLLKDSHTTKPLKVRPLLTMRSI